jgi:hypothetical protein
MPDKMETRVSLTLDPETLRAIDGYNDDTRQFVDCVVGAFSDIHQVLSKLHDARVLAESNGAWTPEMRVAAVSRAAERERERVLGRLAGAERTLRANIAHTEKQLTEPLTERAGRGSLNAEVRAHVKSLNTRSEREKFMTAAFEANDDPTLEALLGGPHFLSGFTKLDHDHYVRTYHERRNPNLVKRLDLMNRFLTEIEKSPPILRTQFDKAVGAQHKVAEAIRVADDRATEALKPIAPTV